MKQKLLFPVVFLALALFYGCTGKEEPNPDEVGHAYFPMNVGDYRIYDVVEVKYLNNQVADSAVYQLREEVDTIFTNEAGEQTYKLIRSKRANVNEVWRDDSVIVVNKSATNVRMTRINNRKIVKLVFPVKNGKQWNANAFNDQGEEIHYYSNVGQPFTVGNQTFAKTLTVVEADNVNVIDKDVREEVYAQEVGLVQRHYEVLTYCNDPTQNCQIGTGYILEGTIRTEKINSYGR